MSRALEMLVYAVIITMQIVVAMTLLAHYPHSAARSPSTQPTGQTVPVRVSLLEPQGSFDTPGWPRHS